MRKTAIISLLFLSLSSACSQKQKDKEIPDKSETSKENPEIIASKLLGLIVDSIDSIIFKNYTVKLNRSPEIDSLNKTDLMYWVSGENKKLSRNEKLLLKKLTKSDGNFELFNINNKIKRELLQSNQETNNLYIQNLNKVVIDSSHTMAITIIGTYFTTKEPKRFLGGWEEIVIFEKAIEKWKERKRLMYIEY